MNTKTIAIIGAGPAGIIAALHASKHKLDCTLFETQAKIGGKMLVAGGGRCNFTNNCTQAEFSKHYGDKGDFLKFAFKALNAKKTREFFQDLGIESYADENNKVFPKSNSGKALVGKLEQALLQNKVHIKTGQKIIAISKSDKWQVQTETDCQSFDYLIIATGGFYTQTKNINSKFWQNLELKQQPLKPALTAISASENHQNIAGITIKNAEVYLANKKQRSKGDILITHQGYSGPAIQNISRYIEHGKPVFINWLGKNENDIAQTLLNLCQDNGRQKLEKMLLQFNLPKALIEFLVTESKLNPDIKLAEITKDTRKQIVEMLTAYEVNNPQTLGFNKAMVAKGGLDLSEVNKKTMRVLKYQGLYVVGEALDIDGDSGGFNIQAALSTGYLATQTIVKEESNEK